MKPQKTIRLVRPNGNVYHYVMGTAILHNEHGAAVETADGSKQWCLHDKQVHPETLVDLWLSRGVFCYYDKEANELKFDA